jgi:hypothetical protein
VRCSAMARSTRARIGSMAYLPLKTGLRFSMKARRPSA